VPDDCLTGPGTPATLTAAELCTARLREHVPGGYRVLDSGAAEVCMERVRELRKEHTRARAREREDEHHAHLAHAMLAVPPCAVLRNAVRAHRAGSTRRIPRRVGAAAGAVQDTFLHHAPRRWHLLSTGVPTCDGYGKPSTAARADPRGVPVSLYFAQVRTARFYDDAGFCPDCDAPVLLPALARAGQRLRPLLPRPRQEPGSALVTVNSRSPGGPDRRAPRCELAA
jgi:hypothetical protein